MRALVCFILSFNCYADLDKLCQKYEIDDCNLVKAIAWIESNHRNVVNENDIGSPSYGILQVKCIAAKSVGFKGNCNNLRKSEISSKYGILFLKSKIEKYGKGDDAIAAYNADKPYKCKRYVPDKCYTSEYVNQNYVNKVKRRYSFEILKSLNMAVFNE
jgi:soluble lytic murein transglycosylase-like protein